MIQLVKPTIETDDIEAMIAACSHGRIARGEACRSLEAKLARYFCMAGARLTNSGTCALHLALLALRIKKGDEVIIPTYTCIAILNALQYVNAKPVLADNHFDPKAMDFNISLNDVKKQLTKRTKAIVVPHMFGVPADIHEIVRLGVPVVEDGTLSLGASCRGRPVGSFGDISVFSFHSTKMIAAGEGGIIMARSKAIARRISEAFDWDKSQLLFRTALPSAVRYRVGYNYRMNDISASLAINQWRKLGGFLRRRIRIARKYNDAFGDIQGIITPDVRDAHSNVFFRYLIAIEGRRVPVIIKRFSGHAIEVGRGVYPPLHYYLKEGRRKYPNAERAVNCLISIPIYPSLTDGEINYVIKNSIKVLRGA